jgi:hypothetical protein
MRLVVLFVVLAVGSVVLLPGLHAQEEEGAARAARLAEVRRLLAEADTYAAVERIQSEGELGAVVRAYAETTQDLYWKAKDVPGAVAVGRAAIWFCLTRAQDSDDEERRRRLRVTAQRLSFDLASFAWPGWREEGVAIGPAELAAGLDFARLDLRLVTELEYPPEKHANAHWIVGAQLLAAGRHDDAIAAFEASRSNAQKAGDAEKEWMADGYVGIVQTLASPDDAGGRERVAAAKAKLLEIGTDDAKFLATQLDEVLQVFSRD